MTRSLYLKNKISQVAYRELPVKVWYMDIKCLSCISVGTGSMPKWSEERTKGIHVTSSRPDWEPKTLGAHQNYNRIVEHVNILQMSSIHVQK